jgi:alpha-D-ribose 1-methylphosphonate 5-phosphate C-P lyase
VFIRRATVLASTLTGTALLATTTAAAEPAVTSWHCARTADASACFESDDDYVRIVDGGLDDATDAVAVWRTDYGRTGKCGPTYHSEICDYDMREGRTLFLRAEERDPNGKVVKRSSWIDVTI